LAYIYDLNAILVRAMPSKNDGAMIAAFTDILATLNARGYAPTLNVMDAPRQSKPTSEATKWISTSSLPTITE
jgi:hypothetical protein